MKILKGSSGASHQRDKVKNKNGGGKKNQSRPKTSKACQQAITQGDDHLDTDIMYFGNDSFSSVASSVTAPPSMTASFYKQALKGWNLEDEEPQEEKKTTYEDYYNDNNNVINNTSSSSVALSDLDRKSDDGDDGGNHWAGASCHSSDSGSVDVDSVNAAADEESSSVNKKKKKKKVSTKLKNRLRIRRKKSNSSMMEQHETIQECWHEETHHTTKSGKSYSTASSEDSADDIYGYGDDDAEEFGHDGNDAVNKFGEGPSKPKAFRNKGRRASMGDMAPSTLASSPSHPPSSEEVSRKHQKHSNKQRRRNSLFGSSTDGQHYVKSEQQQQQSIPGPPPQDETPNKRRQRRHSMFGSVSKSNDHQTLESSPKHCQSKQSSGGGGKQRRRRSLFGSTPADDTVATVKIPKDIHRVVNQERIMRGMIPFQRNMLLDTLCKSIATDMMTGRPSGGCDYFGNVGQGLTLQIIHNTLMQDRTGTSRKNILSDKFTEFGMAVVEGTDRKKTLYMCQLFK